MNNKDKVKQLQYRRVSRDGIGWYPTNRKYKWVISKKVIKKQK